MSEQRKFNDIDVDGVFDLCGIGFGIGWYWRVDVEEGEQIFILISERR